MTGEHDEHSKGVVGEPEKEVYHLDRGIIVARTTEEHRAGLFSISRKIWEGEDYIPTVWDEWISEDGFYTILLGDRIAGCMKYTRLPRNEIMLEGLRMDPDLGGLGYASIAVEFFMGLVDQQEPSTLRFATSDENVYSHHFGEKYGFHQVASFYHRYLKGPEIREKLDDIRRVMDAVTKLNGSGRSEGGEGRIRQTRGDDFQDVLAYLKGSEEWEPAKNLLSYGWVFYPFTEEALKGLLDSKYSFIGKQHGRITGVILADHSRQYPTDIDMSWVTGEEESVLDILTRLFLEIDAGTVREIAGKLSTKRMAGCMERFGFHRHPRVDGTHVFEKRYP